MAPVGQYVIAEMLWISEHFTAGSHKWLPYSVIPTLLKTDLQITIYLSEMRNPTAAIPGGWRRTRR